MPTTPCISKPATCASRKRGLFTKYDFRFGPREDTYWCPAGEKLTYRFQTTETGREIKYCVTPAFGRCASKPNCTRNKGGRRITRWVDEDLLDEMERRIRAHPKKMELHKCLAEHAFATLKHHADQGHFPTRKLPNVRAEMALTTLAYNLKRVIKIMGSRK